MKASLPDTWGYVPSTGADHPEYAGDEEVSELA